jgi:hypothetical protein
MKKILITLTFLASLSATADSYFLSALEFESLYSDNHLIYQTQEKGIDELTYFNFLTSPDNMLGEKAALITAFASYFEFNAPEGTDDYFGTYSQYFERYLNSEYNDISIEMQFLQTLMNNYGTTDPNIEAYNKFAEMMPNSLTVQTVRVVAFAYDIVYNKSRHASQAEYVEMYELDYYQPYIYNFMNYDEDILPPVLGYVDNWRQFMSDAPWEKAPKIEEAIETIEEVQDVVVEEVTAPINAEIMTDEASGKKYFFVSYPSTGQGIKFTMERIKLEVGAPIISVKFWAEYYRNGEWLFAHSDYYYLYYKDNKIYKITGAGADGNLLQANPPKWTVLFTAFANEVPNMLTDDMEDVDMIRALLQ